MIKTLFTRIRVAIQRRIIRPLQESIVVPDHAPEFNNVINESHRKILKRGYQQAIADVRKNIFRAHGMTAVVGEDMKAEFGKRVSYF